MPLCTRRHRRLHYDSCLNKAGVDSMFRPRAQYSAVVYEDKVKQRGATTRTRWKFVTRHFCLYVSHYAGT